MAKKHNKKHNSKVVKATFEALFEALDELHELVIEKKDINKSPATK